MACFCAPTTCIICIIDGLQVRTNKRYAGNEGYTVSEVAAKVKADFGNIDVLVHSLANGPEVTKPLLETSRKVRVMGVNIYLQGLSLGTIYIPSVGVTRGENS